MTGFLEDGFTRYRISSILIFLTFVGLLFGIWKFLNPTEYRPEHSEGWVGERVIMSQQALDIIAAPDRITAEEIEVIDSWKQNDLEQDYRVLNGPIELEPSLASEVTKSLTLWGKQVDPCKLLVSQMPTYCIRLRLERGESRIDAYLDLEVGEFAIYEQGYPVGGSYKAGDFLVLAWKIRDQLRKQGEQ